MPCRRSMADLNASASSDNTLRGCRKAAPCFSPYSVVSLSLPPVMLRRACPNMGILGGQPHEACHWSGSAQSLTGRICVERVFSHSLPPLPDFAPVLSL